MIEIFFLSLISYLLCSISMAVIVAKIFNLQDPRAFGSNNPGATNVLRIGGKLPGILTLLGDSLKALLPVIFVKFHYPESLNWVLLSCILGHIYPIYFKFKGGKGVATAFGAYIGFSHMLALYLFLTWLFALLLTRTSSLAAIVVALMSPIYVYFLHGFPFYFTAIVIASLLVYKHVPNIKRLIAGTEVRLW